ncbi:MAG: iron-sulfur cluster assembly accessory protein [Planctomycetota bacterium]|jgi:iron-sulfur cluster assembly protein|nr:iron-sulfur cluster assembly accessory protein [Planctomycetota bacterium]MDG1405411.1 iron-sulfur cluster assembly accessory protein [Planctomycetota bacterium]MDG2310170.1 iron-sulfur cluster assembly accessory protein [Planctomycetota bacterium]
MTDTASRIVMTDSAIAEVKRLIEQTDFEPALAGVRVGVKGGGCSGFTYTLNFDKSPAEGDEIFDFEGVRLFCDPKSLLYLNGITLEYTTGLQGKGFQFINPNATGTCGCGDSFSV